MNSDRSTRSLAEYGKIDRPNRGFLHFIWKNIAKQGPASIGGVHFQDLDERISFTLAVLFLVSNAIVFAYTLYSTTTASVSKRFLSLDQSGEGTICSEVPQILNSAYQASYDGLWESDTQFNYNKSIFVLSFNGQGVNNEQYAAAMGRFQQQMAAYGRKSAVRPTLWSLVTWAGFTLKDPETRMEFYSTADAGIIFDNPVSASWIGSVNGICSSRDRAARTIPATMLLPSNATTTRTNATIEASTIAAGGEQRSLSGSFDLTRKQYVMRFPLVTNSRGVLMPMCAAQGSWTHGSNLVFNSNSQSRRGYAELGFDVRMTNLAMSLNAGVTTVAGLVRLDNAVTRAWGLIGYTDPYYKNPPLPYPLYCLDKARAGEIYNIPLTAEQLSGPEICFIVSSFRYSRLSFFYPIATQVQVLRSPAGGVEPEINYWMLQNGDYFTIFAPCRCPRDALNQRCNQGYYFSGFYYDLQFNKTNTILFGVKMQQVVLSSGGNGDAALTEYLEPSLIYTSAFARNVLRKDSVVDIPLVSWTNATTGQQWDYNWAEGMSLRQLSQNEFRRICDAKCGIVFFYTYSYRATTSVNLPMNQYDVSIDQLNTTTGVLLDAFVQPNMNFTLQMCVDTFSQPRALSLLAQQPPVQLVQTYFECRQTPMAAFTASIGNAAATSTLYVSVGWLLFGLLYVGILRATRRDGALVLTHALKDDLESTQSAMRNELLYEALQHLGQRSGVPASFAARVGLMRCLFVEQGEAPREDWEHCGREISWRLHAQGAQPVAEDRDSRLQRRSSQSMSPAHLHRGDADAQKRRPSRQGSDGGLEFSSRLSLSRTSHPLHAALQALPVPSLPGGGRRGSGRASLSATVHQL